MRFSGNKGQKEWRETVRAFRNAVALLKNPDSELFADVSLGEQSLSILTLELPLVDFSPFSALPDDPGYGKRTGVSRGGRNNKEKTHVIIEQALNPVSPAEPQISQSMSQKSNIQDRLYSESRESIAQPPVFSFRHCRECINDSHKSGDPMLKPELSHNLAPEQGTGSILAEKQQKPAAEDEEPDLSNNKSLQPMSLMDNLTDALLHKTDSQMFHQASGTPLITNTFSERGALYQNHSPQSELSELGVNRPIDQAQSEIRKNAPPTGEQNEYSIHSKQNHPEHSTGFHSVIRSSAIELIDSLAEHLFSSWDNPTSDTHRIRWNASEERSDSTSVRMAENSDMPWSEDRSAIALTPHTEVKQTPVNSLNLLRSRLEELDVIASATGQQIDADTLASLINDVLVKQAQRYGVDLS
ncbi:hypothetical protein U27_05587 [Candidatus Vecturithrix granuli]|uniref:Uncharacterized protein n=1 Tax=Vecturithrix granuli TaxID=1499967 RepID=A0A081C208_VECG1|nr:hypothetical protein U27_05587 [Candidatus Vecturithrix granuli]